jgi:hypothetical protein
VAALAALALALAMAMALAFRQGNLRDLYRVATCLVRMCSSVHVSMGLAHVVKSSCHRV